MEIEKAPESQSKWSPKFREYVDLNEVYKTVPLESENYIIDYINLSENDVFMAKLRGSREYWTVHGLKHDFNYVRLSKKGEGIMMSDTPMERNSNRDFVINANGNVLVFGLGLGLIILPLLSDPNIKSIRVVELYQDLIDIVAPVLKPYDINNKLDIRQGNAFEYVLEKGLKFDTIYFDIWQNITTDNYEGQKTLTKKFSKHLNRDNRFAFMDCWLKKHLAQKVANEKREERMYPRFRHNINPMNYVGQ